MESYCVIQFKNKEEKVLVANLLVTNTDVDFKMTADLKTFVAEKFNVNITGCVEMKEQSTDMSNEKGIKAEVVDQDDVIIPSTNNIATEQAPLPSLANVVQPMSVVANQEKEVKKEAVTDIADAVVTSDCVISNQPLPVNLVEDMSMNQNVDVISTTTDTIQNQQHSTQSFSIPDPIVIDQPIPDIDNSQNLMNMDDYETFVPYSERPVESEVGDNENLLEDVGVEGLEEDMIGDVNAVGLIANDEDDNISEDDELMPIQADTSSLSTTRRSKRVTKKPRYSMDEDSDKEYSPPIHSSKTTDPTEKKNTRRKSKKPKCNKCGTEGNTTYAAKINHVTMHTDIMKFECLVDGCGYECKIRGSMLRHIRRLHRKQLNAFTKIELTPEQNAELDSMMRECFNDSDGNSDDNCQVCNQNIGGKSRNSSACKREHALNHVNFMLYKCMEDGCSFESKVMSSMTAHGKRMHPKSTSPRVTKIKLTKEQESEIEDMLVKCFPNLDKDGSAT